MRENNSYPPTRIRLVGLKDFSVPKTAFCLFSVSWAGQSERAPHRSRHRDKSRPECPNIGRRQEKEGSGGGNYRDEISLTGMMRIFPPPKNLGGGHFRPQVILGEAIDAQAISVTGCKETTAVLLYPNATRTVVEVG